MQHIESFSFVTKPSHKIRSFGSLKATDTSRLNQHDIFIYGVQPSVFNTTTMAYVEVNHRHSNLMIGEQLYTAAGS